jgi:predicted Zn-dependent protease
MLKLLSSKKNRYKRLLGICLFLTSILIYNHASAGYKVHLKNGNVINAEDVKDAGSELRIYYWGGELSLDKEEIEKIVETTTSGRAFEGPSEEKVEKLEKEKEPEQNIEGRLKEIAKRKEEMVLEKERLDSEQLKLNEDFKKEGRLMSIRERREFENRSKELEEKIKGFNEELNRLDQEEQRLLNTLKSM